MKLCRYERDWQAHWGYVDGEAVYALRGDPYGDHSQGERVGRLDELPVLAPATPETIWSLGANYPSRCAERGFALPTQPGIAVVAGSSICGTDVDVRIPEFERRVEYGVELAIVMRRDCENVEEADVDDYVLGYTGLNNIWVKDAGSAGEYVRPLRVYDNCCPTGLVLDTEVDPDNTRLRLWVDGELRQDDSTSTVVFKPRFVVSWLSKRVRIRRGDVIMTGSPGGIEGKNLRFGQTMEIEVEGVGRVRNRVLRVDNAAVSYVVSLKKWLEMREQGGDKVPASFN